MAVNQPLEHRLPSQPALELPPRLVAAAHATRSVFVRWMRDSAARRRLGELDDHILRDMGFDPVAAKLEAQQPFWKPFALRRTWDR
jgi:uncharacterized protein YjiS (DUF1127 family)